MLHIDVLWRSIEMDGRHSANLKSAPDRGQTLEHLCAVCAQKAVSKCGMKPSLAAQVKAGFSTSQHISALISCSIKWSGLLSSR